MVEEQDMWQEAVTELENEVESDKHPGIYSAD